MTKSEEHRWEDSLIAAAAEFVALTFELHEAAKDGPAAMQQARHNHQVAWERLDSIRLAHAQAIEQEHPTQH